MVEGPRDFIFVGKFVDSTKFCLVYFPWSLDYLDFQARWVGGCRSKTQTNVLPGFLAILAFYCFNYLLGHRISSFGALIHKYIFSCIVFGLSYNVVGWEQNPIWWYWIIETSRGTVKVNNKFYSKLLLLMDRYWIADQINWIWYVIKFL